MASRTSTPGRSRRRGRPPGRPLSARELAARRANLVEARRAPKDLIYRPTAKRMAASLRNLRRAIAARRRRGAAERIRLNALQHGLYTRKLTGASVGRLGESERDYAEHRELFARLLVPRDELEAAMVAEAADLVWRRLRLFRAQALREARELRRLLAGYPAPAPLGALETEDRMHALFAALDDGEQVLADAAQLRAETETLLQTLAAKRQGSGLGPPAPETEGEPPAAAQTPKV